MSTPSKHLYDYDVAVIGAGPAGLSAAIRLRWVKGYRGIPASVVLIDPDPPGGLAALGGCIWTGPSWAESSNEVVPRLTKDIESLNIPHLYTKATGIGRERADGYGYRVYLEEGQNIRCHAVIIATGFRALHGEQRYFQKGLTLTYKGYSHMPAQVASAATQAGGKGLVIVGHRHTLDILPLLTDWAETAGGITLILQPPVEVPLALPHGIHLKVGFTRGYGGEKGVDSVRYEPATLTGGHGPVRREDVIKCGAVFVDYHAFERRPEEWDSEGMAGLHRNNKGFIPVDAHMATPRPGIFAAGDVTGRYASTAMAIGDGICSGFSAYSYVFQQKFGRDPSLFAYAPTGTPPAAYLDRRVKERPFALPARAKIILLARFEDLQRFFDLITFKYVNLAVTLVARGVDVADFRTSLGLSEEDGDALLFRILHQRLITLHNQANKMPLKLAAGGE